ncbi:MFS transporter [Roseibium sp. SCPC15]|uniref:MFS transporter n=1 Tax=Roseibium sp. SCP15 TaxID=3141376 RepID=UPI00333C7820
MFHGPILIVFYVSHGLSLQQVYTLQAIHFLAKLLTEIPAGMFADRVRRRTSLALGALLVAGAYGGIWAGSGFLLFAVMEFLAGAGRAFMSGADSAYIYDELKHRGELSRYSQVESTNFSVLNISFIFYALASGLIASVDIALPYLFSAVFLLAAAGCALLLPEQPVVGPVRGETKKMNQWQIRRAFSAIWKTETLLFATLIGGVYLFLRELNFYTEQPLLTGLGIDIRLFGVLPAVGALLWAVSSFFSPRVFQKVGTSASSILVGCLTVGPAIYLVSGSESLSALVVYAIFYVSYGLGEPLFRILTNRAVEESSLRSTVLSIQSSCALLPFCVIGPWFGSLLDTHSLPAGFGVIASCASMALVLSIVWLLRRGLSLNAA